MTTSYTLTGDFNDLLGEEPRVTGAWLETNLPAGTALVDLDANKVLLAGPKRITLDASNVFSISLIATNSTGTNVTDGTLRYRVRAQYSDGTGVPRTWESGFFDLTAAADLSDKVGGAGDLDVTIAPSASLIDAPTAANVTGPSQTRTALDAAIAAETATLLGDGRAVAVTDKATGTWAIDLIDTATNLGGIFHIDHAGSGGSGSYGLDIRNRNTAGIAFVIHNYSTATAMQIDGVQGGSLLKLRNAKNEAYSPGTQGVGDFLDLYGYSDESPTVDTRLGSLNHLLAFVSYQASRPWQFSTSGHSGTTLKVANTNGGRALEVTQASTTTATESIYVTHTAPSAAVVIDAAGSAVGNNAPLIVNARNFGAQINLQQDGAFNYALLVRKNGIGAGFALEVINKGTGHSITVQDATVERFAITAAGLPKWTAAANVQTTVGAAGAAAALPATPSKYFKVVGDDGTTYVLPAYAAA